jgi:hypothetical protein
MHAHGPDEASPQPGRPSPGGGLVRLSPGLYWYRDTCNVYLLVRGDRGLLIDFGSSTTSGRPGCGRSSGCSTRTTTGTSARATPS